MFIFSVQLFTYFLIKQYFNIHIAHYNNILKWIGTTFFSGRFHIIVVIENKYFVKMVPIVIDCS